MHGWFEVEEEVRAVAIAHLGKWGDCESGPTRLDRIAAGLGIIIASRPCWVQPGFTGIAVQSDGFRLVVVNTLLPPGRKAFTVAHEIGHLALEHCQPRSKQQERLADVYATELLMPAPRVLAQLREHGASANVLARLNGVSYSAMSRRLKELGAQSEGEIG